ncbi:lipopolysaccharide biosynthesis protein [Collinsella sp.]|jgi:O-antigen/teichoic acid export membrane protein|uniref:lipopolysaccharide biosynthesis protein n=1 Tax=Collinsella sp. TaxID=1965294 RepID=UPI0039908E1C
MTSAKSNTSSFLWSFLEQGGSKAIIMVVQIILARLLSPEAFGVLAILLVVTQVADSIAQSGLGMALIQKSDANDGSYSTAWWLSIGLAAMLYVGIFLGAPAIAVFYNMPDLITYLRVLGLIVFFNSANSIQRSFLQRSMNFKGIFIATTAAALASGIGGIALAFFGFGVWALVVQSLLQSVFICIVMWTQVSWKPKLLFDVAEARDLFGYGWKICITGILNVLYSGISELVLGRACSSGELGLYSQGRKYPIAAIGVMSNAIANVLFPMFSSIKGDVGALRDAIRRGLTLGTFIVAPISLLVAVAAEPLVVILLSGKWLACVPIFQLTCISNAILMLQLVNLRAYMALGDSSLYMRLQIIKVLGGGAIIWITAALTHDIYATAWANFFVGILSILFVDAVPAKRLHGYSALCQIKDVLPILGLSFAAAAAGLGVRLLNLDYVPELFAQCIAFSLVYLGGARLFKFKELSEAVSLMRKLAGGGR